MLGKKTGKGRGQNMSSEGKSAWGEDNMSGWRTNQFWVPLRSKRLKLRRTLAALTLGAIAIYCTWQCFEVSPCCEVMLSLISLIDLIPGIPWCRVRRTLQSGSLHWLDPLDFSCAIEVQLHAMSSSDIHHVKWSATQTKQYWEHFFGFALPGLPF